MNAHLTPHAEEIFLQATPFESRAARLIQGVVQEIEVERVAQRGAVGNIVMGRITRVLPGMQAAFVEAGFSRTGFLHVADVWQARLQDGQKLEAPRPIERVLYEGQQLMVQVLKDPLGSKGARLSTQLSIAGRYLVYLPYSLRSDEAEPRIGISQRIADPEAREALKARLLALKMRVTRPFSTTWPTCDSAGPRFWQQAIRPVQGLSSIKNSTCLNGCFATG
jgi:ribonuclease G